jgi:hypothetical protein
MKIENMENYRLFEDFPSIPSPEFNRMMKLNKRFMKYGWNETYKCLPKKKELIGE